MSGTGGERRPDRFPDWPPTPEPGSTPRSTRYHGRRDLGDTSGSGGVNPSGGGKTGAVDVTVTLAADPRSAGVARRLLRDHLASARAAAAAGDLADDAAVVLSELVGNAVRHARGPIRVTLRSIGSGLRMEVHDAAPDSPPQPRPADGEATGGRGMHLVHGLSTRWGWDADAAGKTVWAELG